MIYVKSTINTTTPQSTHRTHSIDLFTYYYHTLSHTINSRWICQSLGHILPEGIPRDEYMLVTIFLGANDAAVCMNEEKDDEKGEEKVDEKGEEGSEKKVEERADGMIDKQNPPDQDGPLSAEDSTKRGQSSSQYVPLQEYRNNIITIIMHVKKVVIPSNTNEYSRSLNEARHISSSGRK